MMPTMLAVMLYSLYGVMDGLFVGRATGDVGLAAVNIGWPIVALIMALGVGIGSGGSILISYYTGRGEHKIAREVYGTTIGLLMIGGAILLLLLAQYENILHLLGARAAVYIEAEKYIRILLSGSVVIVLGSGILPVLRNIGMAVQGLICMIVGVALNIGINFYLMMILNLGVSGAAYGTVIAQGMVVVLAVILISRNKMFGFSVHMETTHIKQILKSGITPFGIYMAPSITLIFTNLQCLKYGGEAVVASYAVISYIVFPVLSILGGVGDGTQPLISYYFGAKKSVELQQVKRIAYAALLLLSGLAMTISIGLSEQIAIGFGLSEIAREYFVVGMRISAVAFLGQGFTKFNGMYLNATMRPTFAVGLTYLESLVVSPCMLFVLPLMGGVLGIWLAPTATAIVILLIYRGRKWLSQKQHKGVLL